MNGSVVLKVSELCSGQTSPSGNFLVDVYVFPEDRVGSGSKSRWVRFSTLTRLPRAGLLGFSFNFNLHLYSK